MPSLLNVLSVSPDFLLKEALRYTFRVFEYKSLSHIFL